MTGCGFQEEVLGSKITSPPKPDFGEFESEPDKENIGLGYFTLRPILLS